MTWIKTRLKHLCVDAGQYGLNVSALDYASGGYRLIRTSDIDEAGRLRSHDGAVFVDVHLDVRHDLKAGDLLLSRSGTIGRAMLLDELEEPSTYAGYLVRFRPLPNTEPRFLAYVAASHGFQATIEADAVTSTIQNFNAERYANIQVVVPPLDEQRRIADFLDAETARIDRMIEIRRASKSLVEEKVFATITNLAAVGAGSVQRTNDPWLPLTGAGWVVVPLKRRWRIIDCKHRTPLYVEDGYPVISPGDITPGRLDPSVAHRFVDEEDYRDLADDLRRARRGDIVYGRNASVGVAAFVDTDEKFTMGQDVCRITSADQDQLFLAYFLNTAALAQLGSIQVGSTFTRVNIGTLLELSVACPPREEQRRLAAEMDMVSHDAGQLSSAIDRQLSFLAERRQALITAAVTGGIAV